MFKTVDSVLDLFHLICNVSIYVRQRGYSFTFPIEELPDSIRYMQFENLENPEFYSKDGPICFNISEDEFDDYFAFLQEYKDYREN